MKIPAVPALPLALHLLRLVDPAGHVGDAELAGGEELQVNLLGETAVIAGSANQDQHTGGLVTQSALLGGVRRTCRTEQLQNCLGGY